MNNPHPPGAPSPTAVPAPDASFPYYPDYGTAYPPQQDTGQHFTGYDGYDGYSTGTFDHFGTASYGDDDPLFGALPVDPQDAATGAYSVGPFGPGAAGTDDTTGWNTTGYPHIPAQPGADASGQWDVTGAWQHAAGPGSAESAGTGSWDAAAWDTTGQWGAATQWDGTGQYDLTASAGHEPAPRHDLTGVGTGQTQFWDTTAYATLDETPLGRPAHEPAPDATALQPPVQETAVFPAVGHDMPAPAGPPVPDGPSAAEARQAHPGPAPAASRPESAAESTAEFEFDFSAEFTEPEAVPDEVPSLPHPRSPSPPRRDGARGRRRACSRPKRSAILTVAVPSVAALGVTAVAAASVSGSGGGTRTDEAAKAVPDTPTVQSTAANSKLDTQLARLTADADDFADRANRTQERLDLQARQALEKKRKAQQAALKERLRPKFMLPVTRHGLSAYFGQAGINWMSVHTGIDFPVSYGTPVMAATDGTVRTQWNPAYGNMAIVTSPDGTETWYCHLSSTKIRSGSVKAGDVIAYSGNSGNSTGPHLHFEVRPGGGSAVDPLPWLRRHGLDPA
ncbi:peptidoglycan DD-metalloendopeptidase family protein [Streptomyces sp. B1866]|nr:peptidoglycan DD-metalloendopeptidase family protein [Streptomyces sp. B1866]